MVVAQFPVIKAYKTQAYLLVAKEADTGGSPFNRFNRPDGELTVDELTDYRNGIQKRLDFVQTISDRFGDIFGGILPQIRKGLEGRLDVAKNMLNNFGIFANAAPVPKPKPLEIDPTKPIIAPLETINARDIIALARRDGNVNNITQEDIFPPLFILNGSTGATGAAEA